MRSLAIFLCFLLICNIAVAQKTNSEVKKGDQVGATTHITPNSSGVKRSIGYRFSSDQSDMDPGNGVFRYDSDNPSGITYIFLDNIDISGEDQTKWYSTWDDTTGATARGQLLIVDDKGGNKSILNVSGVFVRKSGYWKIPVEFVSGNMPVDGSVYYYVFNRIAKKQKEIHADQVSAVTQTNQDTIGQKETVSLAAAGAVLVSQANNSTQVVQENQVTQEKKENQENELPQKKNENQITQEKKENQGNEIAQVSQGNKKKKETDWDEVPQGNQQKQVTSTNPGKEGTQNNQITVPDQGKKETQVKQETKVNQIPQNKPVNQPLTVNQGVQNNTTTQNKPVAQTFIVNQAVQNNNTTQVKQETKVNQTPQNKPVTQTTTTNQSVQNTNTNKVQQETKVTASTQTVTSSQTSTVSQTNQYSVYQNSAATQSTRHRKCYRGIIEIGYDLGLGNYGINNFKFNFINGFKIGPYASVGLGIGYRRYYYKNEDHTGRFLVSEVNQVPVFLDLRTSFSGRKLTPYLAVGLGGSTGSGISDTKQEGLYFTASGGIWYNISERLAIFAGIAYDLQRLEFSDTNPYTNNYNKYASSLGINIGISF
jgi:hypothetical protein